LFDLFDSILSQAIVTTTVIHVKSVSTVTLRCVHRKDIPQRRVRRWSFSIQELVKDAAGREHFLHFLEKEFSAENLK